MRTAEQIKASLAKGVQTRRANIAAREKRKQDAITYANGLGEKISFLEKKLADLDRMQLMNLHSASLGQKSLLTSKQIVEQSTSWEKLSGVYFLIDGDEVVYVGQSLNIFSRINNHKDKKFDRYAYVNCDPNVMDRLESLYIHFLKPKLNGLYANQIHQAPLSLDALINLKGENHVSDNANGN